MDKACDDKEKYYEPICCTDIKDFLSKVNDHSKVNNWIFKGLRRDCWPLKHTFERSCERFNIPENKRRELESYMIREFKRRLHHYTANTPSINETDEWLALMQHHGAPTRLLDFTYSPYVAADLPPHLAAPTLRIQSLYKHTPPAFCDSMSYVV